MTGYRGMTLFLAVLTFALGLLMLVGTISRGGGIASVGVVLGALFMAAGAGRFYLVRRRR